MAKKKKARRRTRAVVERVQTPAARGGPTTSDVIVSHTNVYRVQAIQPITLTVIIGDAQVGGTALSLNGVALPFDSATGVAKVGAPGHSLVGSILQSVTTVQDVNPMTNKTSVTHTFTGGQAAQTFPFSVEVPADSGLARYILTYLFTL